jgi:hypothetical protein
MITLLDLLSVLFPYSSHAEWYRMKTLSIARKVILDCLKALIPPGTNNNSAPFDGNTETQSDVLSGFPSTTSELPEEVGKIPSSPVRRMNSFSSGTGQQKQILKSIKDSMALWKLPYEVCICPFTNIYIFKIDEGL